MSLTMHPPPAAPAPPPPPPGTGHGVPGPRPVPVAMAVLLGGAPSGGGGGGGASSGVPLGRATPRIVPSPTPLTCLSPMAPPPRSHRPLGPGGGGRLLIVPHIWGNPISPAPAIPGSASPAPWFDFQGPFGGALSPIAAPVEAGWADNFRRCAPSSTTKPLQTTSAATLRVACRREEEVGGF